MAKVKLNPMMESLSGTIGELVFRNKGGRVIVARRPSNQRQWTDGQAAHREQFRLATVYGRTVMADPATKALYDAKSKATGTPVFALAIADFFSAPEVDEIDLSAYAGKTGDKIIIRAHDDFALKTVAVTIRDTNGQQLEHGDATKNADTLWNYIATANVPIGQHVSIEVTATDYPGHQGTKVESK